MSEISSPTPNPTPSTPAPTTGSDLNQEVQALRGLVIKLQSALIALTWIVGVYIFIHYWRSRGELEVVRPQAAQVIEAAKRTDGPINQFVTQLVEYSRSHPDFVPIISKYPIQMPATNASAPAPLPATGAAPKPTGPATTAPAPAPKK